MLFTDGGANIRPDDTVPEAIKLRTEGARIVTMSVGTQIDVMEMMAVASSPANMNVISTNSFNSMNDMMSKFVTATCDSECEVRLDATNLTFCDNICWVPIFRSE